MSGKKQGNRQIGGDEKTRKKVNARNPRGNKKGGRTSLIRGKNKQRPKYI